MATRLNFEERKSLYKATGNMKTQLQCKDIRREFQKEPPMRVTNTGIRDQFEANGAVQNVHEKCSGRLQTSSSLKCVYIFFLGGGQPLCVHIQSIKKNNFSLNCAC